jgi:hypothetical protein
MVAQDLPPVDIFWERRLWNWWLIPWEHYPWRESELPGEERNCQSDSRNPA